MSISRTAEKIYKAALRLTVCSLQIEHYRAVVGKMVGYSGSVLKSLRLYKCDLYL